MAKRRPSGDGMVRKREDGRWEGRIVVGHKKNGTPIFQHAYAHTQKELTEKLHQNIERYQDVELTEDSHMTLGEWLDRWLTDYKENTVRPGTLAGYRSCIENYIKPQLGGKQVSLVTSQDVQKLYRRLKENGRVREHPRFGSTLSDTTINRLHAIFHQAMEDALHAHIIAKNPTVGATVPKANHAPKHVLTNRELDTFLDAVREDKIWGDFFYVELTTGLRRGEICGLMWQDFDARNGVLQVRRTLHNRKLGVDMLGKTKTRSGERTIVLPRSTAEILRRRKENAITQWIFPDPVRPELPLSPNCAYTHMKAILHKAGLPDMRFHDLRHTFATHAIASGVDAKTLSGILGHTNASFTLDTYTHVTPDMQKAAFYFIECSSKGVYYNRILYICNYRDDGLTKAGRQMRIRNPLGGKFNSNLYMDKRLPTKTRIKKAMLYVCYAKFSGDTLSDIITGTTHRLLVAAAIIPGSILYLFWKIKYKEDKAC